MVTYFKCINRIAITAFLLIYFPVANAQQLYTGTKTPYQYDSLHKLMVAPNGYTPFFINYVGRHGARFLTKAGSDDEVIAVLNAAEQAGKLTEDGMKIKKMAALLKAIGLNNYGNITLSGELEQHDIAKRMQSNYPYLFKGNGLDVMMTYKIRTQQSAASFLSGMNTYPAEKINKNIASDSTDYALRFYDMSPAYIQYEKSAAVNKHIDSLYNDAEMKSVEKNVCHKLFTDSFFNSLQSGIKINLPKEEKIINCFSFVQSLYNLYTIHFSVEKEMALKYPDEPGLDFEKAFNQKDLYWLDLTNDAEDFFEKGPADDTLGIQAIIAVPLLIDFINSTDSIINGNKKSDAVLRFTHAEAISPFATLLGIPEASHPSNSAYTFNQHWLAKDIIPLSANIQWVVYKNGKDFIIKILLNEKEVALPIHTAAFPYYKWEDIKNYYINKLHNLHTDLHADMIQYLLSVHVFTL